MRKGFRVGGGLRMTAFIFLTLGLVAGFFVGIYVEKWKTIKESTMI